MKDSQVIGRETPSNKDIARKGFFSASHNANVMQTSNSISSDAHHSKTPAPDNYSNWLYIIRAYLFLALVIGLTLWFYQFVGEAGWNVGWTIPVTTLAIFLVGAGQHHLLLLAHEATHFTLFRNRILNELVSDLFCMFPLFGCTIHLRLQELAHHEFLDGPNDAWKRHLQAAGLWPDELREARWSPARTAARVLRVSQAIRHTRIRTQFQATGDDDTPYGRPGWRPIKTHVRVGVAYVFGLIVLLALLVWVGNPILLWSLPPVAGICIMFFFALIPYRWYFQTRIEPVISWKKMTVLRFAFITALFWAVAFAAARNDYWLGLKFYVLWMAPLATALPFWVTWRHLLQHGPGCVSSPIRLNPVLQFCLMPLGQRFHEAHHEEPDLPHYLLPQVASNDLECREVAK